MSTVNAVINNRRGFGPGRVHSLSGDVLECESRNGIYSGQSIYIVTIAAGSVKHIDTEHSVNIVHAVGIM